MAVKEMFLCLLGVMTCPGRELPQSASSCLGTAMCDGTRERKSEIVCLFKNSSRPAEGESTSSPAAQVGQHGPVRYTRKIFRAGMTYRKEEEQKVGPLMHSYRFRTIMLRESK